MEAALVTSSATATALSPWRASGFLGVSKVNVGDGDPRSPGDIAIGDRCPNAASPAGDERDFVLELHD